MAENRVLRERLARYKGAAAKQPRERLWRGVLLSGCRSYPLYLWHILRHGGLWKSAKRVLRPTLFIRRMLLLLAGLLVRLESGALFLLLLPVAVVLFPVALILSFTSALLLSAIHARDAARLKGALRGKTVLLLDGAGRDSRFFRECAADLAERGYTVLLIGASMPRERLGAAPVSPGVYALRPGFYYYLRRRRFLSPARIIEVAG